jgi:hypothetical protein
VDRTERELERAICHHNNPDETHHTQVRRPDPAGFHDAPLLGTATEATTPQRHATCEQ